MARRVRVVCAFDKYKGTLDAWSVCKSVAAGLRSGLARFNGGHDGPPLELDVVEVPLSDGGDGFVQLLARALGLRTVAMPAIIVGPLGPTRQPLLSPIYATSLSESSSAHSIHSSPSSHSIHLSPSSSSHESAVTVLEMCAAAGITLVPADVGLDVMNATTYGVGQMLRYVYERGARDIVLGLGGSATNDGGIGALQALGVQVIMDGQTTPTDVPVTGALLGSIERIVVPAEPLLPGASVSLACDVRNPYVGAAGAVAVFSAQKGASAAQQAVLERGMQHAARLLLQATGRDVASMPGAGAAGGLAGGLHAALGAPIVGGMELVERYVDLDGSVASADLVLTGEGAYDASSDDGKVVSKLARLAARHDKPLVVVCGRSSRPSTPDCRVVQLLSYFDADAAMTQTARCLETVVETEAPGWLRSVVSPSQ